jgi:hypothetical protein
MISSSVHPYDRTDIRMNQAHPSLLIRSVSTIRNISVQEMTGSREKRKVIKEKVPPVRSGAPGASGGGVLLGRAFWGRALNYSPVRAVVLL